MITTDFFKFFAKTRTLTTDSDSFREYFIEHPEIKDRNVLSNDGGHVFALKDCRTGRLIDMVRTCVETKDDNDVDILSVEYRPLNPQSDLWFDRVVITTDYFEYE